MNEQDLLLTEWHERATTMNMQQAVQALEYWVSQLEEQHYSDEFQTRILELIVKITRRCNVLSNDEST